MAASKAPSIRAVIFDLDGVLCELDHNARLAELARATGVPEAEIHEAIWESGFEDMSDTGMIDADEYLRGFGDKIGFPMTEEVWVQGRRAGSKPMVESLALVGGLQSRAKLALLTNNGLLLKRNFSRVFPGALDPFGPHAYVSAEFKASKPDARSYLMVCEAIDVPPQHCLMIDDREENVQGAKDAGLTAYRFRSAEELGARLTELGLL